MDKFGRYAGVSLYCMTDEMLYSLDFFMPRKKSLSITEEGQNWACPSMNVVFKKILKTATIIHLHRAF